MLQAPPRWYLSNDSTLVGATPSIRGSWNATSGSIIRRLRRDKNGAATTIARTETTSGAREELIARWKSEPFENDGTINQSDSFKLMIGLRENASNNNIIMKFHIYVIHASTDTLIGTLAGNSYDYNEWPVTAQGVEIAYNFSGTVNCLKGHMLVIEIGFYNSTWSSNGTATINYGGTGATDLSNGDTAVTTNPGWIEFYGTGAQKVLGKPERTGSVTVATAPVSVRTAAKKVSRQAAFSTAPVVASTGFKGFRANVFADAAVAISGYSRRAGTVTIDLEPSADLSLSTRRVFGTVTVEADAAIRTFAHLPQDIIPPPGDVDVITRIPATVVRAPLRIMAQVIRTGEWMDKDVRLSDLKIKYTRSGPTIISGKIRPESRGLIDWVRARKFSSQATWLHVVENGEIAAPSCIIDPFKIDDQTLSIEALGFSAYAKGKPFLTELSQIQIDPLDVVRIIWAHLQSYPDGNLGVTLDGTTSPRRLGEPSIPMYNEDGTPTMETSNNDAGTPITTHKMSEPKPYVLAWYSDIDCGREIDTLAVSTPFDYLEHSQWNAARTEVLHHIRLAYPRIGAKRPTLSFRTGSNIRHLFTLEDTTSDTYASSVLFRGKGEGRDAVRSLKSNPDDLKLRQVVVITDKTIGTQSVADRMANDELRKRQAASLARIDAIRIKADHPSAPRGSFGPGDDILVQGEVGWAGRVAIWCSVSSIEWDYDANELLCNLEPAERFTGTA